MLASCTCCRSCTAVHSPHIGASPSVEKPFDASSLGPVRMPPHCGRHACRSSHLGTLAAGVLPRFSRGSPLRHSLAAHRVKNEVVMAQTKTRRTFRREWATAGMLLTVLLVSQVAGAQRANTSCPGFLPAST